MVKAENKATDSEIFFQISNQEIQIKINPIGAELMSIKVPLSKEEIIWQGDKSSWQRRAPWLFPIVGKLKENQYQLNNKNYLMNQHGFARDRIFTVLERTSELISFELLWDEQSLKIYPFKFRLVIEYSVQGASLKLIVKVYNLDKIKMTSFLGFHPGFNLFGSSWVQFEKIEKDFIGLNNQGLVDNKIKRIFLKNKLQPITPGLFKKDVLILDSVRSKKINFFNGHIKIEFIFKGWPCLALWSKGSAPFVCLEPWHGLADLKSHKGDFNKKKFPIELLPGECKELQLRMNFKENSTLLE